MWICIPDTLTPGSTAMIAINLSVWPAAIQSKMQELLQSVGGEPLEYLAWPEIESFVTKLPVPPRMSPTTYLPASHAALVMEIEGVLNQMSSLRRTEIKPRGS